MTTLTVTDARRNWSDLYDRVAFKGERILLRRNGKQLVALVPAEDAGIIEALEDQIDLKEAERRLASGTSLLDYEEVRSQLGLD